MLVLPIMSIEDLSVLSVAIEVCAPPRFILLIGEISIKLLPMLLAWIAPRRLALIELLSLV